MDISGVRIGRATSADKETCETCPNAATMVINSKAQCDKCAGTLILGSYPEVIGALVSEQLRQV
jgi:hypothetical protein